VREEWIQNERFCWKSLSTFFILSTRFLTREQLTIVRTAGCVNVILSSLHGGLTASNVFTSIQWSSHIAFCAKYWHCCVEKRIHCLSNWGTITNTTKRWYYRLSEMRRWDRKQGNILFTELLNTTKRHLDYELNLSDENDCIHYSSCNQSCNC
jgi:hypothetical protein